MQNATTTSGPLKILLSVDISHLSWGHSAHSSMTVSANLNYCRCSLAPSLCWRAACTGYQLGDLIWQNQVYLQPHLHPKRQLSQLTCLHAPDARQVDNTAAGHRVDAGTVTTLADTFTHCCGAEISHSLSYLFFKQHFYRLFHRAVLVGIFNQMYQVHSKSVIPSILKEDAKISLHVLVIKFIWD